MEANVGATVGRTAQRTRPERARNVPSLHVRLLGPLTVTRGDVEQALPASRKVRALFAYLQSLPPIKNRTPQPIEAVDQK